MQEITLTIRFRPGQGVAINGPLNDKGLCYMMLKLAEKAVDQYRAAVIEVPDGMADGLAALTTLAPFKVD